jgi:hypothetical protein
MNVLRATLVSLALPISGLAHADPQALTVTRNGSYPSAKGPSEYFTGSVRVEGV